MDKIVSLCKRRGFIFPASEIYGGIANTYDYGHYGVLLKNNVIDAVVEGDDPGARRHRRARLGDHPAPAHVGGLAGTSPASPTRWSTAAPASCASAPTTSATLQCGRKPSKHPGEDAGCDLTEAREFNLMFETTIGPVKEAGSTVYLRPETAQGIFLDFKHGAAVRAPQAAVRDRAGRQVVPQRDHAGQLHLPHARVRADGDGVLRPARRGAALVRALAARAASTGTCGSASSREHLRLRAHDPDELSHYSSATSDVEYLFPIGWSELEGIANRGDFDLTQHAQHLGREARVPRPAERRALRPARDRARRRRRALRCSRSCATPTTRTRSAASSAPCCGCTRALAPVKVAVLPLLRKDGQPGAGARGLRGAAPPHEGRVRRGRRDRPPLPPPGRDRDAVRGHDRPPVARGPHRHACATATRSQQERVAIDALAGHLQARLDPDAA